VTRYTTPRPLAATDDLTKFDCGETSLNEWLLTQALQNSASGASRTFVTTYENRVVGYYALAAASVERRNAPGRIRRNQPEMVPVILLARLAVDQTHQGRQVGSHLLRDAVLRTVRIADNAGVRALLVHAVDQRARNFYQHYDFMPSPTDDLHLYLLIKDAQDLLAHS
jgi:GNAT superfamily N-acetyltransferase